MTAVVREFQVVNRSPREVTLELHESGFVTLLVEDVASIAVVQLERDELERLAAFAAELVAS